MENQASAAAAGKSRELEAGSLPAGVSAGDGSLHHACASEGNHTRKVLSIAFICTP